MFFLLVFVSQLQEILSHERVRSLGEDTEDKRCVLICGSKCDLERKISHKECVAFAKEMKCGYCEVRY